MGIPSTAQTDAPLCTRESPISWMFVDKNTSLGGGCVDNTKPVSVILIRYCNALHDNYNFIPFT